MFIGISGKRFKIEFLAIFYIVILTRVLITFETEYFFYYIKVFIGILGERFLAIFYMDFNKGFNQI